MNRRRHAGQWILAAFPVAAALNVAHACDIVTWKETIEEASRVSGLDARWIRAVMRVESDACEHLNGRPTASPAGAMGLMQLMPATWNLYRQRLTLGSNPYDPHDNILAGAQYLSDLILELGVDQGIAAYYAGPRAVAQQKASGLPISPSSPSTRMADARSCRPSSSPGI